MLHNASNETKTCIILPDGRIELFFSISDTEPFHVTLLGLGTHAEQASIEPKTKTFAISFKLLATEYIFKEPLSKLLDHGQSLSSHFWGFTALDLYDFDAFCKKASENIHFLH